MFNFIRDLYKQGKIDGDDVLLYIKQGYLYPEEAEAILEQ